MEGTTYIYNTKALELISDLSDFNFYRKEGLQKQYPQHKELLTTLGDFLEAQYRAIITLMITVNHGDQTHYTKTMKLYKDEGILSETQFNDVKVKIDKNWEYTSSILKVMESVPNYKGQFEKLLAPDYQNDYKNAINAIADNLDKLDPKTHGEKVKKFLEGKTSVLEKQIPEMTTATDKVKNILLDFKTKTYEFEKEFGTMDFNYNRLRNSKDNRKKSLLDSFPKLCSNMDEFLNLLDNDTVNAKKAELKKVSDEVMPPVLSFLYSTLKNMPSELRKVAGLETKSQKKKIDRSSKSSPLSHAVM